MNEEEREEFRKKLFEDADRTLEEAFEESPPQTKEGFEQEEAKASKKQ